MTRQTLLKRVDQAQDPISGAEGDRTLNLRIANANMGGLGRLYRVRVASVATAIGMLIVAYRYAPVKPATVASDMRSSLPPFSYPSHLNNWRHVTEDNLNHEAIPMETPLPHAAVPSLDELRKRLVKLYANERTKKSSWRMDRVLRQLQALGVVHLSQITRETLSEWRAGVSHLAPRTQKGYYSAIVTALNYAVESGWIHKSPARIMPMRFSNRKVTKKRHLTWDEMGRLFQVLAEESGMGWKQHRLFALSVTLFATGMRVGEVQRIKVSEINLAEGLVDLTRRSLKTDASSDYVALPNVACDVLARWLPVCGSEWAFPHTELTGPWVSGSPGNKPLDCLQAAARRAGIEKVTFAMARHGWVTHAIDRFGLTAEQVASQTRHTDLRTQEHYRHRDAVNQRKIIAGLVFPGLSLETDQPVPRTPGDLATG